MKILAIAYKRLRGKTIIKFSDKIYYPNCYIIPEKLYRGLEKKAGIIKISTVSSTVALHDCNKIFSYRAVSYNTCNELHFKLHNINILKSIERTLKVFKYSLKIVNKIENKHYIFL